jgi:putative MATE family efflux protein
VQPTQGTPLTEVSLLRATVSFGTPLVVAMALGALFNLVDLYIVGRMARPEVAIAAVTIGSLVNSIPMIIFNGIVNAIIALVARFHGLGHLRRANVASSQGFLLTMILSVVFGFFPWLYAEEICLALGAQGEVVAPATEYLAIVSVGTFTMFLLMQITGVMRAVGNSLVPLVLMGGANLLNVILDVWFIFGGLGLEPMGVAGAAWATVVARGLFCIAGLLVLYRGMAGLRLRRWVWRGRMMWQVLAIGIPSCAQWLVRMVSYLYILSFVAKAAPLAGKGVTEAQAAFGVGLRLDTLALFSGFGWGAAAATLVGQNLGAGRPDRARRASWIALGLNMAMMLVFAAVYVVFAESLLGAMGFDLGKGTDTKMVRDIGRTYLYVASSGFVFLAVAVVLSQALAGAGATKFPLLIELVAYGAVGYPFVEWVAGRADQWGLRGLWLAAVALHLAVAIAYVLWFRFGPWARKEIR